VREYGGRTELAPQGALADAECDTTQSWSSGGSLGAWSLSNTSNLAALDENTTRKSMLYLSVNAGQWEAAGATAPILYQALTGDFDLIARVACGKAKNANPSFVALGCIDPSHANNFVWVADVAGDTNSGFSNTVYYRSCVSGTATDTKIAPVQPDLGGTVFLRLKRASGTVSGYIGNDGANWTTINSGVSRSDLPSTINVGVGLCDYGSTSGVVGWCDFVRNTLPFDTTSPTSSIVLDSGATGTSWTPSSFAPTENPAQEFEPYSQVGFGTLRYQIGASDTNSATYNGSWLSASGIQALSTLTGRYLFLEVQYNSAHGYDTARFAGATIGASVKSGGWRPRMRKLGVA
jgi:hypothetical protein